MPTIPNFSESKSAFPEAPASADVAPERFGRDAAALSQLGGDIANFGSRLMQARKQAEEADAVFKANQEDIRWRASTEEVARQEFTIMNPDGTVSFNEEGYAERMRGLSEERLKGNLESMPTGDAQRSYLASSGRMFSQDYVRDLSWENRTRAEVYAKNFDQALNTGIIQLENNPDILSLERSLKSAGDWINNSPASPLNGEQKAKLFQTKGREAVFAYFDGLSRSKVGADAGLKMLDSLTAAGGPHVEYWKDGQIQVHNFAAGGDNSYLNNFLDGKDVAALKDKLLVSKKQSETALIAGIDRKLSDSISSLVNGTANRQTDENVKSYLIAKRNLIGDDPLKLDEWRRDAVEAQEAKLTNEFRKVAAGMSPSSKAYLDVEIASQNTGFLKEVGVPENELNDFASKARFAFDKKREDVWKSLLKERSVDPVGYLRKYNLAGGQNSFVGVSLGQRPPDGTAEEMVRAQLALGVSPEKVRLLSNAEAKAMANAIESAENPNAVGAQLLAIQGSGPHARSLMNELVKHGKLDEKYRSVGLIENEAYAKVAVEAFRNKEAAKVLSSQGRKDEEKSLQAEVQKQFKEYFGAIAGAGDYAKNTELALGIQEVVSFEARQKIANNELSVSDAVRQSMTKLVKQSFDIRQGTLVPRQVGGHPIDGRRVEGEMKYKASPEFLKENIRPIKDMPRLEKALGNSRWIVNKDQSGAILHVKTMRNEWVPLFYKNGTPVSIDYIDADMNTSPNGLNLAPEE